MKISRSYLLGLGSGLILSALIAMVVPPVSINIAGDSTANQGNNQKANEETNQENDQDNYQDGNISGNENQGGQAPPNSTPANTNEQQESIDKPESTAVFTIPSGSTADKIADLLLAESWISSKEEFLDLVKERNLASRFRTGSFELSQGMSAEEILEKLIP